jgi:predicted nucleic acid-binding protein
VVALIDASERSHQRCRAVMAAETALLTTWPAATEAMYLLGDAGGWPAQRALWLMIERGVLEIAEAGAEALKRMPALMERYRDVPMDLADASLVAIAESRGLRRIFTLDSDFQIYRLRGRSAFEVVPGL